MHPPDRLTKIGRVCLRAFPTVALAAAMANDAFGVKFQGYDFGPVEERIQNELARGIPSISVAVVKDEEIIWEAGFGWADRERAIPATEHTVYTLCSVAKGVTATGLMVLVERGLVDLDRPVNDYLGEAKLQGMVGDAAEATVRRVANHTSGLPRWYNFFFDDEPHRRPPMDQTIRRYGKLVWKPGEFRYSNLGYGVLDYVIERVSGKDFGVFMQNEVFVPLRMTHSSVLVAPDLAEYAAFRYERDGTALPFFDTDNRGGGAIYSSAHDMALFGLFLLEARRPDQKPVLSDASIAEMLRPTAQADENESVGVGWHLSTNNKDIELVEHFGTMPGATTAFTFVPAESIAVVVLSNGDQVGVSRLRDLILEALDAQDPPGSDDEESGPTAKAAPPVPGLVDEWAGAVSTYQGDVPISLRIDSDGSVHGRLSEGPESTLDQVQFDEEGMFAGLMRGSKIDTEDVRRRNPRYAVGLRLKLRGDALNGEAMAFAIGDEHTIILSHWVELKRVSEKGD